MIFVSFPVRLPVPFNDRHRAKKISSGINLQISGGIKNIYQAWIFADCDFESIGNRPEALYKSGCRLSSPASSKKLRK